MAVTRRNVLLGAGAVALVGGSALTIPMFKRPGEMVASTSRAAFVETSDSLPESADVVVLGAGIMGVATAYFLAKKGLSVVICEKGEVACEQSSRAYGQVSNWGQQAVVTGLGQHSKSLWSGMNAEIGADTSYRNYGRVQAFDTDEDIEAARAWAEEAALYAPDHAPLIAQMISGEELRSLLPGATSSWKAGLYIADDGGMEPAYAAPAMARAALALGVKIVTGCAVRAYETEAGAISAVVTEKGVVRTKQLVVAGGSWSRLFLGNADQNFPVLPVYLSQQRLSAVEGPPAVGAAGRVVWRKEVDGSYSNGPRFMTAPILRDNFQQFFQFAPSLFDMLMSETPLDLTIGADLPNSFGITRNWRPDEQSPFESRRIMAPTQNDGTLDEALSWIRKEFPVFEQSQVIERWAGTVDVTADEVPIISPVTAVPGLYVMGGFTFGLTQGLGAGDLMADLVTGAAPKIDPAPYHLERFS